MKITLDPKHPGINDEAYKARRQYFFDLSRKHRLAGTTPSVVDYQETEEGLWRLISAKLHQAHERYACQLYLEGKHRLGITEERIPQQSEINHLLSKINGFSLVPAEGLLDTRDFFSYLTKHRMPCTQFLRHASHPEYTPEPDMIHDMIGHVPPLVHSEYIEITNLIGQGVMEASEEQLKAWDRVYWFSIEFSLIEEKGDIKIFGAGHLSSFGEMEYAMSEEVEKRPYNIDEVTATDYDNTRMQDLLFVIPSLDFLKSEVLRLLKRFGVC